MSITIADAMADPQLLGKAFQGASWDGWRAILRATFGLPMSESEATFFKSVADREPPNRRVREAVFIAGRRAGKDSIASAIATYAAAFGDYRSYLRPGERAVVACLAVDREQAKIVLGYIKAFFAEGPLKCLVERETADGLDLTNGVSIEVVTNSFRHVRGRTYVLVIFDEVSFWRDEATATPDRETYRAIKPGLATIPGAMLVMISSPYRKSGLLYEKYKKHYGKAGDILVIKAPSRTLNPTLDQSIIDDALAEDPAAASAEWLAEFRDDIAGYIDRDVVESLVISGRRQLAPAPGVNYVAFVDPSGGVSDAMTLAVAHREKDGTCVLDAALERRPPFSPDGVVQEFAATLKLYRLKSVTGDRYGGEWPRERFAVSGIRYEASERPKSDLYRDLLPILNSGKAALLDLPRLTSQLCALERRTSRGGRDSIDHAPGSHDDIANAVAGAITLAAAGTAQWIGMITDDVVAASAQRTRRAGQQRWTLN